MIIYSNPLKISLTLFGLKSSVWLTNLGKCWVEHVGVEGSWHSKDHVFTIVKCVSGKITHRALTNF